MPWEIALRYASLGVICVILLWIVYELIRLLGKQIERLTQFIAPINHAMSAMELANISLQKLSSTLDNLERNISDQERRLSDKIDQLERRISDENRRNNP